MVLTERPKDTLYFRQSEFEKYHLIRFVGDRHLDIVEPALDPESWIGDSVRITYNFIPYRYTLPESYYAENAYYIKHLEKK